MARSAKLRRRKEKWQIQEKREKVTANKEYCVRLFANSFYTERIV